MNNISQKNFKFYFVPIVWNLILIMGLCCCVQQPVWNTGLQNKSIEKKDEAHSTVEKKAEGHEDWNLEFSEDFSQLEIGSEPDSIFVLDGLYTVQKQGDDERSLLLPGTPMGDFGLLFGPRIKEKSLEISFSFFASKKGRRMPSIAAGIGGVRGYRLRLNPASRNIVFSLDEEAIWQLPLSWQGDKWWSIRFRAMPGESNQATRLSFKLWPRDQQEPTDWVVSEEFGFVYEGGKCALWGFPYSSTPILFDDIRIFSKEH